VTGDPEPVRPRPRRVTAEPRIYSLIDISKKA
jgi:hypothetical protein